MDDTLTPDTHRSRGLGPVSSSARRLIQASVSENTKVTYDHALSRLEEWLGGRVLTDALLSEYLTSCHDQGMAPASIALIPAAVRFAARLAGENAPIGPLSERTLAGIRREGRQRGRGQATGITFTETKFLVGQIAKNGVRGIRDAALFSLMSDCMLRISELVAVRPADIEAVPDESGRLHIAHSKTDQEGSGATLYIGPPTMERIHEWTHLIIEQLGDVENDIPLFRSVWRGGHIQKKGISGRGIRKNLKAYVDEAGLRGQYRGHSFRVGTAQSLAQRGATLTQMQTVGRWQTARMPAAYCRNELAGRNAVATLLYKNEREHN